MKGLADALGIDREEVTSPSFTLVNPYAGRLRLYHLDLYRLDEGASAANAVDLQELLTDEDAVIVIEWAERLGSYPLSTSPWHIRISGDGDSGARNISAPMNSCAAERFVNTDVLTLPASPNIRSTR